MLFIGDSGYALQPFLMTPFRALEEGSPQSRYNHQHAKGRNIVERTIGLLKNRFRCILGARELHYTPEKATQITNICVALHSICVHYKVQFAAGEDAHADQSVLNPLLSEQILEPSSNDAEVIRDRIMHSLH